MLFLIIYIYIYICIMYYNVIHNTVVQFGLTKLRTILGYCFRLINWLNDFLSCRNGKNKTTRLLLYNVLELCVRNHLKLSHSRIMVFPNHENVFSEIRSLDET